jgi:hypothetical protein
VETNEDVEKLEKLIGQLQGMYAEIGALAKKSPSDSVNGFKLKLINKVIEAGNSVLGVGYKPFDEFDIFDSDDAPTTSDVTMVIAQYIEEAERFRSDNVQQDNLGRWYYSVGGNLGTIQSSPPTRIGRKR